MDYDLRVSTLENQKSNFPEVNSKAEELVTECNNLKIDGDIASLKSKVTEKSEKITSGYKNFKTWIDGYVDELKETENSLVSKVETPTLKGDFTNIFKKILVPALKTNASDEDKDAVKALGDYSRIYYKKVRYAGTTIWYAVIPKDKMPNLGIANDNYNYLTTEAPSEMARRKKAKLAINFGLTGDPAGMIYANGILVNDTGNPYDETLYMTKDGRLNSVRNSEYSTQDIINMDPVWASKGFYTIARDGQYVDENYIDPSLSVDRHPRTFIGQDYDGNYIVGVCDGRSASEAGLTLREVYDFVNTEVTDNLRFLFNGDGGGSSAFIYDGNKLNSNTDGSERERPDLIYWT